MYKIFQGKSDVLWDLLYTDEKKKIQDGKEILNLSEQQPQLCFFIYLIFFLPKSAYIFSESMIYLSLRLNAQGYENILPSLSH